MRVGGRVRCARGGTSIPRLLCLCISVQIVASSEYGVPIEIKLWDSGRTPLAHMVDVTNGFGLKVLAEHNFLNDNNIAFSPYGLMGILVALYEGVDGESSFQLKRSMDLPWSRNVMRVGFRDIHRTLKTYFVPEEGFLAGLALNNENVTFNDNYKTVLRFYGFDLDNNEQIPTLPPTNGTNATTTSTDATTTTTAAPSTAVNAPDMASTQAREDSTTNPNAETLSDLDLRGPTTTTSPSSAPNAESTTSVPQTQDTTTQMLTTQTTPTPMTETTQTMTIVTTTSAMTTTTTAPATEAATTAETESVPPQTSSAVTMTESTVNNEIEDTTPDVSSSSGSTDSSTTDSTLSTSESTQTENTESTSSMSETESEMTSTPDSTTMSSPSTIETLERRKKSIVDFLITNPPYLGDDYFIYRSYDIPVISPEPSTSSFNDNQMFLANGLRNVQVTYMHYDTILDHAYLPHLEASALRLPLDSDRYYLLVILPSRGGAPELGRLLARMARESDLSDVCAALRPRRVRALVPSFTVKGHVTLTTDLQKLGIRDVFEPRQRDFSPMTRQPGVYVRSIEQAVSVAIRKYRAADAANSSRYVSNRQPVSFAATYPFLYFVMDSSIHVSLMAGKMVDPLNSRIL